MAIDQIQCVAAGAAMVLAVVAARALDPISLPVLGLLLLVLVALAALSPVGATGAVVMTLPLFFQPLTVNASEVAVSELLLGSALVGSGIQFLYRLFDNWPGTKSWAQVTARHIAGSPLFLALLTLTITGAVLLNFLFDPAAQAASLREWRWTLLEPLLLLILLLTFCRINVDRYVVVIFFLAGGLVLAIAGLLDLVTGGGIIGDAIVRISGPYPHPNAFSLYLIRPFILGLALYTAMRNQLPAAAVLLTIGATAMLLAFSRSALLTVALVIVILIWPQGRKVRIAAAGALASLSVLLLLIASERMLNAFSGGSVSLRLDIWQSGLQMIRDRPVAGYGPDQFFYAYAPTYVNPAGWAERFTSHAHNLIIDFWVRLGIIGAIFAATSVLIVFRSMAGMTLRPRKSNPLPFAAVVALGAAIIQSLFDNGYFTHDLAMSAWLLAFLAFDPAPAEGNT